MQVNWQQELLGYCRYTACPIKVTYEKACRNAPALLITGFARTDVLFYTADASHFTHDQLSLCKTVALMPDNCTAIKAKGSA